MYIHTLHVSLHLRILSLLVKRSDTELRNVQISLVSGPIFSSYRSNSLYQVQFFPATSLILSSKSTILSRYKSNSLQQFFAAILCSNSLQQFSAAILSSNSFQLQI